MEAGKIVSVVNTNIFLGPSVEDRTKCFFAAFMRYFGGGIISLKQVSYRYSDFREVKRLDSARQKIKDTNNVCWHD